MSVTLAGDFQPSTALTFSGSRAIPSWVSTWPRKPTCLNQNSHLLNLAYNWCLLNSPSTILRCSACSSGVLQYTRISSMNTTTNLSINFINTLFMRWTKYAGAFVSPNGITVNSYSPYLEVKAVLGISSVRTFNWWYPDLKSIFENTLA